MASSLIALVSASRPPRPLRLVPESPESHKATTSPVWPSFPDRSADLANFGNRATIHPALCGQSSHNVPHTRHDTSPPRRPFSLRENGEWLYTYESGRSPSRIGVATGPRTTQHVAVGHDTKRCFGCAASLWPRVRRFGRGLFRAATEPAEPRLNRAIHHVRTKARGPVSFWRRSGHADREASVPRPLDTSEAASADRTRRRGETPDALSARRARRDVQPVRIDGVSSERRRL